MGSYSAMWGLPVIWQRTGTGNIRPLCLLLPVGLYGVYIAVFSLSMWAMYRDGKRFSGVRWVVVVTFVAVTLYILATLAFVPMEGDESGNHIGLVYFYYIATPWYNMSSCVCCSLSDSVLAWRCYVIFGKRRWLKWTLTIVIIFITVSGIVSSVIESIESIDFFWRDREVVKLSYRLDLSTLLTTLTWAVFSLIFNTVLSTSIIAKIVIVSRQTKRHLPSSGSRPIPLARAFIESSLMSWIALAVYTGLYIAENVLPHSLPSAQGEYALFTILPLIFSISQALVFARLGVSRFAASNSFKDTIIALTSDDHDDSAPRSRAVTWRDVETWSDQE